MKNREALLRPSTRRRRSLFLSGLPLVLRLLQIAVQLGVLPVVALPPESDTTSKATEYNEDACVADGSFGNEHAANQHGRRPENDASAGNAFQWKTGTLRPSDLKYPGVFNDFHMNGTVVIGERSLRYADGSVVQINKLTGTSLFSNVTVLKEVIPRQTVQQMLDLLGNYALYDEDPDTVDGMPTYEMFIFGVDEDNDKDFKVASSEPHRKQMRQQLANLTQPLLDTVITPYVRHKYDVCNTTEGRACTPCYSLIRRYRHGDRMSHATHHDGHAIVTVVVSLSDYGKDYLGGLYLRTGHGQRAYLALEKGDAAVHQSSLLHGVQVYDLPDAPKATTRWSWILWFRDSESCEDHSSAWFAPCAQQGDAVCQQLHASHITALPLPEETLKDMIVDLNVKAARGGSGEAAVKVARAYLKQLPSRLPFDTEKAKEFFNLAIASHNPDGHFGLAKLCLEESLISENSVVKENRVTEALRHLEKAALMNHAFSMFNLGVAHVYGYSTPVDLELGAQWFARSGLPEGYFVASQYFKSIGDMAEHENWARKARLLGMHAPWRHDARVRTGSGGAAGVDLNLPWPVSEAKGGVRPHKF